MEYLPPSLKPALEVVMETVHIPHSVSQLGGGKVVRAQHSFALGQQRPHLFIGTLEVGGEKLTS